MLIRNVISQEFYSYENEEEIQRILEIDSIGVVKLWNEEKWIKYSIDRNICIRLSDLINQIEQNLVRFHFGQILILIQQLISKVVILQSNSIEHDHLDMNRIWLNLDEHSQKPNIIYQFLSYSIHFTGYQCPFYEKESQQNQKQNINKSIRLIIKQIIRRSFKGLQFDRTHNDYIKEIVQNIIEPLVKKVQTDDLISLKLEITTILSNLEFSSQTQTLKFDNKILDRQDSDIAKWIKRLDEEIQSILTYSLGYSVFIAESLINQYISQFVQVIQQNIGKQKIADEFILKANEIFKGQETLRKSQLKFLQDTIKGSIQYYLQQYQQVFKFEIKEEMQKQMEKEVGEEFQEHPSIKYFTNSYWSQQFNNDTIQDLMECQYAKILEGLVKSRISLEIQKLILQLINELI